MLTASFEPRPRLADLRRALIELALGRHTPDSLQESFGRSLARYMVESDLAEERASQEALGLTDTGWCQYVEITERKDSKGRMRNHRKIINERFAC